MKKLSKDIEKRINIFEDNYQIVFSHFPNGNIVNVGDSKNSCRFFGTNHSNITFRGIAHAIPESLGNKTLILKEECDYCNHFFSENIEVHYDKLAKVFRQIAQIKGKKKVPSYKTKDKKSRIDIKDKIIVKQGVESNMVNIDEDKKTMTINYEIEPYIPAAVYKTLVKMALSVMPEKYLCDFEHANRWICEPNHTNNLMTPLLIHQTFIPGPRPSPEPITMLFIRNSTCANKLPHCIFVLAYGNIVQQIVVPCLKDKENLIDKKMDVPVFPTPFEIDWKYDGVKSRFIDFSGTELLREQTYPVVMSFDNMKEIDPSDVKLN